MDLINEFDRVGVDRLRMAIVMQACNDYVVCQRCVQGIGTKDGKPQRRWHKISNTQETLDEVIDFFRGSWYKTLIKDREELSGERVMQRLDVIVNDTTRWPVMGNIFKYEVEDADDKAYAMVH